MSAEVFFDTSVLIYTIAQGDARTDIAASLLRLGGHISVQVLNEFAVVSRRKLRMSWFEVASALSTIREICDVVHPLTVATHHQALGLAERFGYHFYDSLILASAMENGCTTLYSEDMQHGQRIGPLTITNPFL